MKMLMVNIYEKDETPTLLLESEFEFDCFDAAQNIQYFKLLTVFIWGEKLITGFWKSRNGYGWLNGKLLLNQKMSFPVSPSQLFEFKKCIKRSYL